MTDISHIKSWEDDIKIVPSPVLPLSYSASFDNLVERIDKINHQLGSKQKYAASAIDATIASEPAISLDDIINANFNRVSRHDKSGIYTFKIAIYYCALSLKANRDNDTTAAWSFLCNAQFEAGKLANMAEEQEINKLVAETTANKKNGPAVRSEKYTKPLKELVIKTLISLQNSTNLLNESDTINRITGILSDSTSFIHDRLKPENLPRAIKRWMKEDPDFKDRFTDILQQKSQDK